MTGEASEEGEPTPSAIPCRVPGGQTGKAIAVSTTARAGAVPVGPCQVSGSVIALGKVHRRGTVVGSPRHRAVVLCGIMHRLSMCSDQP